MTKEFVERVAHESETERIIQSNDVAGIVIDVLDRVAPRIFPHLDLRYGIADALWDAGYRRVEN